MLESIILFLEENVLASLVIMIISFLPMYVGLKIIGGHVSILKALLIGILLSASFSSAAGFIGIWAAVFVTLLALFVYQIAFKINWKQALLVWILQYLFVLIVVLVAVVV